MSIESVTLSNHLILCHPLLLLLSVFPNIRVFSSESALRIGWQKYWSFNTITPQRLVEIASNRKLIICEHCGRIIINPDFE